MLFADLQQLAPIANGGRFAMRQQQGRFETGEIEQQLIADPAPGGLRIDHNGLFYGHLQPLRIAVAANRQLRTGQTQKRPGAVHVRTPN